MTAFSEFPGMTRDLESHSDEALRDLIDEAGRILKARETRRKKDALAEIRRIAKEHGLGVAVSKRPGRRGRPPKA